MSPEKNRINPANIYEVNLRQYTAAGNFTAFAEHLPRLQDMGVDTLWFMPLTPIARERRKGSLGSYYACSDYKAINPEFGTMDDFRLLVARCHALGMRVIIDWVANHTGWDHVWTRTHPDWYKKDSEGQFLAASGMDDIIELDHNNREMRLAMIEAMRFWVDTFSIDGFRCDLASWVALDFWLEAIPQLNQPGKLFWLAELDPIENPSYMQVFDAAYSWKWMHQTEAWYKKGLPLKELVLLLGAYEHAPGIKTWFTSNHDENSWNGTEYEKYGDAAVALAVHSFTWPGIPLIYSGQEIPNEKRLEFFEKDAIQWKDAPALHGFYKTLITLRKLHPALDWSAKVFLLPVSAEEQVLAYLRKHDEQELLVLLNLSPHTARFILRADWAYGKFRNIMSGEEMEIDAARNFELAPWDYLLLTSSK